MAYVGNTPADKTLKLEKQQFTTSATTSYTLDHSVSDPQDIGLFINNVRQNPNSSYTVSGTALTLSEATASTDTMYCVFLGRAIGTVGIGAGEVTKDKLDLISDSTAGLTVKGDGGSNDGYLQLNCRVNSHGIKLKSPPHSAGATYTLTFPNSVTADKFLKTDGSGNLSFADAGGGKIGQVINATHSTEVSTTSTSRIATGLTASITPSATSSKVLVMVTSMLLIARPNAEIYAQYALQRGGTDIWNTDGSTQPWGAYMGGTNHVYLTQNLNLNYIDSPSTTSSTTYAMTFCQNGGGTAKFGFAGIPSQMQLMEVLA